MKQLLILFFSFYLFCYSAAQEIPKITESKLKNGLTVIICEDHNQPMVFGAVVVKGGSKRDPQDATGLAHYLEHLMFKGTDKLGTTDYSHEKPLLDSITILYDKLVTAHEKAETDIILKQISNLSYRASEYFIPNEMDELLKEIGSIDVNAYTSEDAIVYHNLFPPSQIKKWLEIYSHRFINPVFRTFQNELEVVYEEKNAGNDNWYYNLYDEFATRFFKKIPYQTVIGKTEHLKKPSISKLYDYCHNYYVAGNMALILCGDINPPEALPLIETYFGQWPAGNVVPFAKTEEEPFNENEEYVLQITPVKTGILAFRTVPVGHPDKPALDLAYRLLSNNSESGLLDKLFTGNKLAGINIEPLWYYEAGGIMINYYPNTIQSLSKAKKNIIRSLNDLCEGNFTDELFESVKIELIHEIQLNLEKIYSPYEETTDLSGKADYLIDAFLQEKSFDDYFNSLLSVKSLSKEHVIAVAKNYFTQNYLSVQSEKGSAIKEKLDKPEIIPSEFRNENKSSEFAQTFRSEPAQTAPPKLIETGKDVIVHEFNKLNHLYYTKNPANDIFTFKINFGIGIQGWPVLKQLADYLSYVGTYDFPFDSYREQLQKHGINIKITADDQFFTIETTGNDSVLNRMMEFVNDLITSAQTDNTKMKLLAQSEQMNREIEASDPLNVGEALLNYTLYGQKSKFINRVPSKELSLLTAEMLRNYIDSLLLYETDYEYVGTENIENVKSMIELNFSISNPSIKSNSPCYDNPEIFTENTVFLLDDPEAIQSQMYCYINSPYTDSTTSAISDVFNLLYDDLTYREIRDYRSMAYTATYYFIPSFKPENTSFSLAYLSTQADKTIEALNAVQSLFSDYSIPGSKFETTRIAAINSLDTELPHFRSYPDMVMWRNKQGKKTDPGLFKYQVYQTVTQNDLVKFFNENIKNKPVVYILVGDKSRIDIEKLKMFGKFTEIKKESIFTF